MNDRDTCFKLAAFERQGTLLWRVIYKLFLLL